VNRNIADKHGNLLKAAFTKKGTSDDLTWLRKPERRENVNHFAATMRERVRTRLVKTEHRTQRGAAVVGVALIALPVFFYPPNSRRDRGTRLGAEGDI
jgi:hypothetical protein